MRKRIAFLSFAAALVFCYSCSNDETVAVNTTPQDNEISFRPLMMGMTRAADASFTTNGFYVTALKTGQTPSADNTYFDNVAFTGSGQYTSASKYYWPNDYNLDFYAYSPATGVDLTRTDYKIFTVKANATAGSQIDFVYANTNKWGKVNEDGYHSGTTGVAINFRHTESKVVIMLKNSESNLKFTIGDVSLCNLYNRATFTYTGSNTDTKNTPFASSAWSAWGTDATDNAYTSVFTQTVADAAGYSTSTAVQAGADMILVPQTLHTSTTYSDNAATSPFIAACLKVKLKIQNSANNAYIVGSASGPALGNVDANGFVTAMWPLPTLTLTPGYKYTFTVDLAGGGYYETNQDAVAKLDPILGGSEIRFVDVTVDGWQNSDVLLVKAGSTHTVNVQNKYAANPYNIVVDGLTSNATITATGTNNYTSAPEISDSGTVPSSGIIYVSGALSANDTDEVISVITITESGAGTSVTTINIVQAAPATP